MKDQKIASWMSLKSSEINNCSWIISTVLESPFYSSSCCQTCFPSFVRPMNRLWELFLKIFLHSPEMNRSIFFSMHLLWMTKKIKYFLRYLVFGERIFPWFKYRSIQFLFWMGTILGEEPAGSLLCGFAFAFDRYAKSFALSFNANSSSWSSGKDVSLLFIQIHHKLIWSMRNSDPGVSVVSAQRHNSDLNSMFTVQITDCNFQYGLNFRVSLDPAIRLWCCFCSWKSVFTTSHCMKLCERSAVSFVLKKLSILNNTLKSCIHTGFTQFVLLWQLLNSFFILLQWKILIRWVTTIQRNFWLDHTEHDWGTWLPHHKGSHRSFMKGFIFFTYLRDCSVKTELVCRNNDAKNSLNRFLVGCKVYWKFTMSFVFELTCGQWSRSTENWTSDLSENQHPFSAILSQIPCALSSLIEYHFFSEPGPINDHCPVPNLLAYRNTSRAFVRYFSSSSIVPQETSLNIDINRILPVKLSGVSPNLYSKLLTSSLRCNVLNLGKYSTRIPFAHHRSCLSFCNFEKIWSILIFAPMHR